MITTVNEDNNDTKVPNEFSFRIILSFVLLPYLRSK